MSGAAKMAPQIEIKGSPTAKPNGTMKTILANNQARMTVPRIRLYVFHGLATRAICTSFGGGVSGFTSGMTYC